MYALGGLQVSLRQLVSTVSQVFLTIVSTRMKFFSSKIHPDLVPVGEGRQGEEDKTATATESNVEDGRSTQPDSIESERVAEDAQVGVQKIEATTSVWSKNHLILAYAL